MKICVNVKDYLILRNGIDAKIKKLACRWMMIQGCIKKKRQKSIKKAILLRTAFVLR